MNIMVDSIHFHLLATVLDVSNFPRTSLWYHSGFEYEYLLVVKKHLIYWIIVPLLIVL